jgi:hypothetical protein
MTDRAAVVTTAIMQMIATAPTGELRQAIETYLREEFDDAARHLAAEVRAALAANQEFPQQRDLPPDNSGKQESDVRCLIMKS